jgi:hypothetical protein
MSVEATALHPFGGQAKTTAPRRRRDTGSVNLTGGHSAIARVHSRQAAGGAFIAPALAVLVVMNLLPVLWSFGMSFYRYRADRPHTLPKFVGLGNYVYMLLDEDVWEHF